jgi:hypothetical protein
MTGPKPPRNPRPFSPENLPTGGVSFPLFLDPDTENKGNPVRIGYYLGTGKLKINLKKVGYG